jgi:sulfite exporter TauE/SafE/copper chaperone CopZ
MAENFNSQDAKTLVATIDGMHCRHCEVAIERRLSAIAGVRRVDASFRKGTARITHIGELDHEVLQKAVAEEGYTVASWHERVDHVVGHSKNTARDYVEIGAAFLIVVAVFLLLNQFDVIPKSLGISDNMSYSLALLIGLVASVSTCMAVTGGLLVAVAAKYSEASADLTNIQRLRPHIYFNAGRIVSYTLLGGAVGALGSVLTLSSEANGVLTLVASGVMIVLGLQMLKLFPSLGRLLPRMPKSLAHKVHDFAARETNDGAFVLGAMTFFLPCGFTQALQLYVLTKGSFATGALTMLAFALGTLPALISLSAISSFAKGAFQNRFLKLAGAAVIMLGFLNIQYGLVLAGSTIVLTPSISSKKQSSPAKEQTVAAQLGEAKGNGNVAVEKQPLATTDEKQPVATKIEKQTLAMKIVGFDYVPNRFTVRQGIPVEWWIDASQAAGCGRILIVQKLRVRRLLPANSTALIAFTPGEPGDIAFNCSMGMMTPGSKITVIPAGKG